MSSNSKAMLRHAGEPFLAWGDPLKLRRFYGNVDLRGTLADFQFGTSAMVPIAALRVWWLQNYL